MTRGRTTAQKAADIGSQAGRAILVEMLFDSGALRVAIAQRNFTVGADVYTATGAAFAMSNLRESADGFEGFELSLDGLDSAIEDIMAAEPYRGRIVRVLEQRFDADDATVETPSVEAVGRMRAMGLTEQVAQGRNRVWLRAENFDAEFEQPMLIRFTDADQQRRYSGDLGGEYLAALQDRVVTRGG